MALKEQALEAFWQYQAGVARGEAEERARIGEEARQFCIEVFGVGPDDFNGDWIMVEDIPLVYHHDWKGDVKWFHLAGTCPDCKQGCEATRVDIHDLTSLGDALSQEFRPGYTHHCPARVILTWGERMEALLREITDEVK